MRGSRVFTRDIKLVVYLPTLLGGCPMVSPSLCDFRTGTSNCLPIGSTVAIVTVY